MTYKERQDANWEKFGDRVKAHKDILDADARKNSEVQKNKLVQNSTNSTKKVSAGWKEHN